MRNEEQWAGRGALPARQMCMGIGAMGKCPILSGDAMIPPPPSVLAPCMNPVCRGVPGWDDIISASGTQGQEGFSSFGSRGSVLTHRQDSKLLPYPVPRGEPHGHGFCLSIWKCEQPPVFARTCASTCGCWPGYILSFAKVIST